MDASCIHIIFVGLLNVLASVHNFLIETNCGLLLIQHQLYNNRVFTEIQICNLISLIKTQLDRMLL